MRQKALLGGQNVTKLSPRGDTITQKYGFSD
jgi:hypothetical protein